MGADAGAVKRRSLPGAVDGKLFFAQVREDPVLEIEALQAGPGDTVVVVSSGGCTALSLLAAGAGNVVAVDLSRAQNSMVELKTAAVDQLSRMEALAFLGGTSSAARAETYQRLRVQLTSTAQAYWDARPRAVKAGVLASGVTEHFLRGVVGVIRTTIHPPSRIRRLLACRSLEEQRTLYHQEWNSRRWRLLFKVMLNRAVFRRTYDPAFFANVENPSFSDHFHRVAEHGLTNVPVADNYFLHYMLAGSYPKEVPGGMPPYLADRSEATAPHLGERLMLIDGSYLDYLKTCPDASVNGFALSNICEWLEPAQIDELMGEIVRTAVPGARMVLRNFVGWTEIPPRRHSDIVEDRAAGEQLIALDRSLMQRRLAVCRVSAAGQ